MKPSRKARPMVFDALEDRVVLSTGVSSAASVPVQDAHLVQQAFNTFRQSYNNDFKTILYGTASDGTINPTANRAAFDAAVATDLATLNTSIASDVANLTDGATLATTIQGEILGTGADTLQGQLAALTTPSGAYNHSSRLFQTDGSIAIRTVSNTVISQVRTDSSGSSTGTGAGTTTTTPTSAQIQTAETAVRTAVQAFRTSYSSDISTILYGAASDGSISPSANRSAFDTQVAADLATLNTSVTTALSALPSSTTLVSTAQAAINGSGASSLQSELAALTTPTGPYTTSARIFNLQSGAAISALQTSIFASVTSTYGVTTHSGHNGGGLGGFFHNIFRRF